MSSGDEDQGEKKNLSTDPANPVQSGTQHANSDNGLPDQSANAVRTHEADNSGDDSSKMADPTNSDDVEGKEKPETTTNQEEGSSLSGDKDHVETKADSESATLGDSSHQNQTGAPANETQTEQGNPQNDNGHERAPSEGISTTDEANLFQDRELSAPKQGAAKHEHIMLVREAEDCQILVSYLARQKEPNLVGNGDRAEFIEVPRQVLSGTYSVADVVLLHSITRELHAAAYPATAQSIRDSRFAKQLGILEEARGKGDYQYPVIVIFGFAAFLLTFLFGLYVSFTDAVVGDYRKAVVEYQDITQNQFKGTRLEYLLQSKAGESPSLVSEALAPEDGKDNMSEDFETRVLKAPGEITDANVVKRTALAQISQELAVRKTLLRFATFNYVPADAISGGVGGGASLMDESALHFQTYVNKVITAFALPISASIVGAFVFILRDRTRRQDSVSLVSHQTAGYWPRIMVAIIAGIIIGWFSGRDSSGVLATLTPAAAAFVVGYSLEIFFNLLDSIKTALGVKDA